MKLHRKNKFYDTTRYGQPQIRVYHKKGMRKKSPRYLFKCGCCDQKLEIYYTDDGLEINGVNGAIQDWRDLLLPLLLIKQNGKKEFAVLPYDEFQEMQEEIALYEDLRCLREARIAEKNTPTIGMPELKKRIKGRTKQSSRPHKIGS